MTGGADSHTPPFALWLIDSVTDSRVVKVSDGMVIDPAVVSGGQYAIEAAVDPALGVGSVRFLFNGTTQVENVAPYALFGDANGNFAGRPLPEDPQTITVELFSGSNASGTRLAEVSQGFEFSASVPDDGGTGTETPPDPDPDPVNTAPEAVDDAGATVANTATTLAVLANDADADGDPLSISAFTQGANGSVTETPDSKLTYTPTTGFTGPDSFTYTVSDGNGGTDTASVAVTVAAGTNDTNALRVGPGQQFSSLRDAVAASKPGDTILLEAGVYQSDYSTISHALTIKGVNGLAHLKAVAPIPNGKAILVARADVTLENIKFTDASVPDRNGAGIRHESGDLVISGSVFENNENGILGSSNATATVTIRNSEFIGNGYGDGRSHGIYINQVASLDIEGSTFRDTKVGHHIKSRAQETTVRDSTIDDGQGNSSYSVDLPNGGRAILEGNTLIQTGSAGNSTMVAYGAEGNLHSQNSLLVKDNLFVDNHPNGKGVNNHTGTVITLQGNTFQDVETKVIGPHEFVDAGSADDADPPASDPVNTAPEAAPEAVDDVGSTVENTATTIAVLASGGILDATSAEQSWNNHVTISARDWSGTPAAIVYTDDGFGIAGGRFNSQIDHHPETDRSEQLVLDFDGAVSDVKLRFGRMNADEAGGRETGLWSAYDAAGQMVDNGVLDPGAGDPIAQWTYDIPIESSAPFSKLVIEATGYDNGSTVSGSDSSDFTILALTYTPADEALLIL